MKQRKKRLGIILCCVICVVAALVVWSFSPGPEWMAEQTAQRHLEKLASEYGEYSAKLEVVPALHEQLVGPFWVSWKTYTVVVLRQAGDYDNAVVMDLLGGPFPLLVTETHIVTNGQFVEIE